VKNKFTALSLVLTVLLALVIVWGCGGPATTPAPVPPPAPPPAPAPTVTATATVTTTATVPAPAPTTAPPKEIVKPSSITVAGFDVGGTAHILMGVVAEAWDKNFSIKMRYFPVGTGVARTEAIRSGTAKIVTGSADQFYAMEGLYDFAAVEWGPQTDLRLTWLFERTSPYSLATRADSGIKTMADLKGKKLPQVVASPAPNSLVLGSLAWDGLTLDDVKVINLSTFIAMYNGLLDGTIDAAALAGDSAQAMQLAASTHGIYWVPMPPEDKEGWAAFNRYYPVGFPTHFTVGAGISAENPVDAANQYYPLLLSYKDQVTEDEAYWITKLMNESNPDYFDKYIGAGAGALENNTLQAGKGLFIFPWHDGSIKYLKEIGAWSDRLERNQQARLKRNEGLKALWETVLGEAADKGMKAGEIPGYWNERRAQEFPEYLSTLE